MILDFIPIVLIYLFATYPVEFVLFSNTILGKLAAVLIIIHITRIDTLYGLLACMSFLYYYQTDYVDGIQDITGQTIYELFTNAPVDNRLYAPVDKLVHVDVPADVQDEHVLKFKSDYCDMGKLKYKEYEIKHEMAHHVFSELQYHASACDPCLHTCKYTIERKLDMEDELAPKMSNWEEIWHYIENVNLPVAYTSLFTPLRNII